MGRTKNQTTNLRKGEKPLEKGNEGSLLENWSIRKLENSNWNNENVHIFALKYS